MMGRVIARVVEWSRANAIVVVAATLALAIVAGFYSASRITVDTDLDKLIAPNLPWRQRVQEMDKAFPQKIDLLVIVIDGKTPDQAEDAAIALVAKLRSEPAIFHDVRLPDLNGFFRRNGMLFLPKAQVQDYANQMIAAQPFLGSLAADPSLRAVFGVVRLMAQGVQQGAVPPRDVSTALNAVQRAAASALAGENEPLSWQTLLSGTAPAPNDLRRIVLTQATLDYKALTPGETAIDAVRKAAAELGLTPDRGVRVRITGSVALNDDQLATLAKGAGFSTALSLGLLCLWLLLALRSLRIFAAIVLTLAVGLCATTAFAVLAIGPFNPISVAFAVLFVGISVDLGIQFSVRYRDERYRVGDLTDALTRAAYGIGRPMAVAALAAGVGFFSFVPTDYSGVSDLGWIAGVGMMIALVLNLTLLPALVALLRPRGEPRPVGFAWAGAADRLLIRRRAAVLTGAAIIAVACLFALPRIRFDFNPLDLQNQKSESVATLNDLMSDPTNTPYTIDVLTPSPGAAAALAKRLDALPEVDQTITISSFVPDDQDANLAILADAKTLLGPTLSPATIKPPPTDQEILDAIRATDAELKKITNRFATAERLAHTLDAVLAKGTRALPLLKTNLADEIPNRLQDVRLALDAQKVTLDNIPPEVKRDWVTADGRALVEVYPKGDTHDNDVLRRFVDAVRAVAPDATGSPVTIQESARTVTSAFITAGIIALVAIALLLLVVLRRIRDVALVLMPLLLAGLLTLATTVLFDLPLNYANIIALPLLLGIGVSFDIYFVMRWRAGNHDLLQSSTARAILFSALTTGTAFGSLALSNHPGTASMGALLTISLGYTLLCTFAVLPALLGPAPAKPD
ncbi:MAG: MMPL family transporter [Alphaproteobacteria bacterium]|nr:MMPL family transporter [Alphaproteobacteria bacterium]